MPPTSAVVSTKCLQAVTFLFIVKLPCFDLEHSPFCQLRDTFASVFACENEVPIATQWSATSFHASLSNNSAQNKDEAVVPLISVVLNLAATVYPWNSKRRRPPVYQHSDE